MSGTSQLVRLIAQEYEEPQPQPQPKKKQLWGLIHVPTVNFRADDFELCNLKHHWHHVLQKKVENHFTLENHSQLHELPSSSSKCWQPKPSQGKLEKRPTKSCRFATGPGTDYTSMWIDFSQQKSQKLGTVTPKTQHFFLKLRLSSLGNPIFFQAFVVPYQEISSSITWTRGSNSRIPTRNHPPEI